MRKVPEEFKNLSRVNASKTKPDTAVFVDSHVHIHNKFHLGKFLDASAANFSAQTIGFYQSDDFQFVMCLTETQNANQFAALRSLAQKSAAVPHLQLDRWEVSSTDEPQSLRLNHPERGCIFVIAGRQIVTAERLEVLALGCDTQWKDGQGASDIITHLNRGSSVPVIPWGFGKWYGKRGKVVTTLMRTHQNQVIFLGDNGGRPSILPQPPHFEAARKMGIGILPGSDPLPFFSEQSRAGLFGFTLPDPLDASIPWQSIRQQITSRNAVVSPYGKLESPWRFARNQVAMQWLMRGPKPGGKS